MTDVLEATLVYDNPRMSATIENWPSGYKRVTAQFVIEQTKKGERAGKDYGRRPPGSSPSPSMLESLTAATDGRISLSLTSTDLSPSCAEI